MKSTAIDCCADPTQNLLSVEEARQRIIDSIQPISEAVQLDLRSALKRVLAESVTACVDVPPFNNSAMDGYAVLASDCTAGARITLEVIGASFAGAPFAGEVRSGQCVRIMTGAVLPDGADAVLMQEHVERKDQHINFTAANVSTGENVRYAAEDSRVGETVLEAGHRLGPAEIGLLASVGVGEVSVVRPLRVAFFSTGDELRSVGTTLGKGHIYDSNRYTLYGLLSGTGIEMYDLGVIPDKLEAVREAFRHAASLADIIVTSGGVSVGEADYVTDTLKQLGEVNFWRIAMKPGKPLAFGRLDESVFFGLPGNPVSVMVTCLQFVLPALQKMGGEAPQPPLLLQARCNESLAKVAGRMEFQRGILQADINGGWTVSTTGLQGSHMLSSMSKSNCFILLEAENTGVEKGTLVTVQPFRGLI